jgi:hypothetical protein
MKWDSASDGWRCRFEKLPNRTRVLCSGPITLGRLAAIASQMARRRRYEIPDTGEQLKFALRLVAKSILRSHRTRILAGLGDPSKI